VSGKRDREARSESQREEENASEAARRERTVKLASALGFLALAAVAVLIVVSQSGGEGGDASSIKGAAQIEAQLKGIPQKNLVLGAASAPATLIEFGDLQCPTCKGFSEEILPPIIEGMVRKGEARLEFRNFVLVSEESQPAGAAAVAAGRQGRGWNYIEVFYRNQGEERSGYVTDEFLTAIARAAGVPDIARWNQDRKSADVVAEVKSTTAEATPLGFGGTPSFAIEGQAIKGMETIGTPSSTGELESAVEKAAG
jgi:protein-disulfide isomerase